MKPKNSLVAASILVAAATGAGAAVHYVDLNSANPTLPYTNWATAAHVIQDAVDVAVAGEEVLVTNGTYAAGGRVACGNVTNRVAVTKPLFLHSVNGPGVTVIQGQVQDTSSYGQGSIRCVYLTNGASLSGFTLTNGVILFKLFASSIDVSGGGLWCESTDSVISNCVLKGNSATDGGGAYGSTLNDCTLVGNSARAGGGVLGSTLNNSRLSGNSTEDGGGAFNAALNDCNLAGNSASEFGGGAMASTLTNCTLTTNSAHYGGALCDGDVHHCVLTGNSAYDGGGVFQGTVTLSILTENFAEIGGGVDGGVLSNCVLSRNSAANGGGAVSSILTHCTVTGNAALNGSGGVQGCTVNDSIIYFNSAAQDPNYDRATVLDYCCTTPLPSSGVSNIAANPRLASASHLSPDSPCRGAGSIVYTTGTDTDGEPWFTPPSIGCDEYHWRTMDGRLAVAIISDSQYALPGHAVTLAAVIDGKTDLSVWEFDDGELQFNEPYTTHSWPILKDHVVTLWAFNRSHPAGVSTTMTIHVEEGLRYVSAASTNPVPPYRSWANAATNIQDALDLAPSGGTVVVADGLYGSGARAVYSTTPNRVAVIKPLALLSLNGPDSTVIDGGGTCRCAYLADGSSLHGFTVSNGAGGVLCQSANVMLSNCVVAANYSPDNGGGVLRGTLLNSTLRGNGAAVGGGGAYGTTLVNCTLSSNGVADQYNGYGGGAAFCTMSNCCLNGNLAPWSGGGAYSGTLQSCTLNSNRAGHGGGATLSALVGCTLTGNSGSLGTGGAETCTLSNCTLRANLSTSPYAMYGGGATWSTLVNCTVAQNSSIFGGGANTCTLTNCTVIGNWATNGGGAFGSILSKCTLIGNSAAYSAGASGSALYECTLTGNGASMSGGGAGYSTLHNCSISGNSAQSLGGGTWGSDLTNCVLNGNSASIGGGCYSGLLVNSTVVSNTASSIHGGVGGGTAFCGLFNSIVYFNSSAADQNYSSGFLKYCCTTPPAEGIGNFSAEPDFMDLVGGDLRLQSNSPCINAGNDAYAPTGPDLDGNLRIVGGGVDIGAYEYQSPASVISYAWLQNYGLPTDGSADYLDSDGDGMNNWQEWRAGTNPTNASSVLRALPPTVTVTNVAVAWRSVPGMNYIIERASNVFGTPPLFRPLATGIPGQPGTTVYHDTNALSPGPVFYRVGVEN